MAIVVLVLWLFTAGAGFYLLVTSNLGRARAPGPVPVGPAPQPAAAAPRPGQASRHQMRRAARERWDPPSLTAAKQAPVIPGARSLVEFAHPACGIIGLGFWLGFTLIHNHALGWIAFGLVAVTACLGLTWFAASARVSRAASARAASRAARARAATGVTGDTGDRPAPSFSGRLTVLHGGAAAVTVTLAALTALVVRG
jgi:hypothetical protein